MRLFYVLYPEEPSLRFVLDAIRFLANPYEKERAHLTVRGPCSRHYRDQTLQRLNEKIASSQIVISGVDRFFAERQHTVFLSCDGPNLKQVWLKPDYGYHPHITLYDGDSRDFGAELLAILQTRPLQQAALGFRAGALVPLATYKGQTNLTLQTSIDFARLSALAGRPLSPSTVRGMPGKERLALIAAAWETLPAADTTKQLALLARGY
jgi:hypothetical protein